MKTITNLLVGIMALFCCSIASAQFLIYSNSFVGGNSSVSVYQTAPTYATNFMGGSSSAVWICTLTNPTSAFNLGPAGCGTLYQNGGIGTNQGCALLPLAVQTNAVYILSAQLTLPTPMAGQVEIGFTMTNTSGQNYTNFGLARFNDSPPNGFAWDFMKVGAGTTFFGGSKTANSTSGGPGGGTLTAGLHNLEIILSTLNTTNAFYITNVIGHGATNYWIASSYIDGRQVGTNIYYVNSPTSPAPLQLGYCGLGQATFLNQSVNGIQWNYFTVSTPLLPLITQQPVSGSVNQGSSFLNSVVALADTNGGALFYQWYTNGIALAGATNASLVLNPVLPSYAGTNYYVVVTNTFGAVTSSPASLSVFGPPQFTSAFPVTYNNLGPTNLLFLYGGTNNGVTTYNGSSPIFTVLASGAQPISYQWLTNGVPVGSATNTSFTYTNCQWNSPTSFACVASNVVGTATNYWLATYLAPPTTPFQQAVLAARPLGYWRLNEKPDNGSGNNGAICTDYQSGNNGIYTNVYLDQPSAYSPTTDPAEISVQFGTYNLGSSDANSIGGNNIDFSSQSNAEYTVALWANGSAAQGIEPANAGLLTKGYFSAEEFSLDTAPSTFCVRLTLRNAAGTQFNALSKTALGTDPNWHYIVGVCDESNGLVSLYIDGSLAAYTSIPPGSGIINSASTPIMIGARSSTATSFGDNQFEGNINDAAVYGYAMTPSQVLSQYQAAGGAAAPYLLPPFPPTNIVVAVTNTALTIPATTFGAPPFGYYWTNLNTATVLGSGATTTEAPLDATLTLSGITPSMLWSNVLELVVTNASGSTNWFVTLSAPPPPPPTPMTIGYTNSIVYSNTFVNGTLTSINGTSTTLANMLVGGTNSTWICTYTNTPNGSNGTVYANGTLGTNAGNAMMPFIPEPGYIYTMTGTLIVPAGQGNWVSMGFAQSAIQSSAPGTGRFTDPNSSGYGWMFVQAPNATFEAGPRTSGSSSQINGVLIPSTNTMQLILNTVTNNAWVVSAYINGNGIATNYYNSSLPIAYAGIGQNAFPGTEQWVSWSLSAVSPNGFPPYLLAPLPPTSSIVLTNGTITLNATGFGTGPWGYNWINNSSTLVSGATNNTAPNSANISIASTSLSAGQLELVLTNALGTNITIISLLSPIPTTGTNITWGVTNDNLSLSWPNNYTGWQLQAQTNNLSVGINTNWANVSGSTTTNRVTVPINLTNGSVFYRLIYTP